MVVPNPGNCFGSWSNAHRCFIGTGEEVIALDAVGALVQFGHPGSDEQNVALFESDT